jgi:hypothetical protein
MVFNATPFQQYFSYILAVSFIGGGNLSTRNKTTSLPQATNLFRNVIFHLVNVHNCVNKPLVSMN